MSPLVGCGFTSAYSFAFSLAAGTALVVSLALAAKGLVAFTEQPRPPVWPTVAVTALEPIAYYTATVGLVYLHQTGWNFPVSPSTLALLGTSVSFVCVAGLHGALLGRVDPSIGEARRLGLSILYSLPVPGLALGGISLMIVL